MAVERLFSAGKAVYRIDVEALATKAADAARLLTGAAPGVQLVFDVRPAKGGKRVRLSTSCVQRPVWQLFPTRDRRWVLWRSRDFYFDASRNGGEDLLGYQLNFSDPRQTPRFVRAPEMPAKFKDPLKVQTAINKLQDEPGGAVLPEMPPALPVVTARPAQVAAQPVTATVRIDEPKAGFVTAPDRVQLWLGDRMVKQWDDVKVPFSESASIEPSAFRSGENRLFALALQKGGGSARSAAVTVTGRPSRQRTLYAVAVGIDDYSASKVRAKGKAGPLPSLRRGVADARAVEKALLAQKGKLYDDVDVTVLTGPKATRAAVLAAVMAAAKKAKANDVFVFHFAGHADADRKGEQPVAGTARLALADYDAATAEDGSVGLKELAARLAPAPCRKLILVDARSNGRADVVRELTAAGGGPMVLAGSWPGERGQEDAKRGGLFTRAVLDALEALAADAATKGAGLPALEELYDRVDQRLEELANETGLSRQNAVHSAQQER
jgi:hypothetical protein